MRYKQIEFRYSTVNECWELVRWHENNQRCHVIAFFRKGTEGYDMHTVGERYFQDHAAWVVGRNAMRFLNEIFELEGL